MNIILIGFMGTGKSSVAPVLADKLNMEYIEMDKLIEKKAGKSIEKIFKDSGENVFRGYEISVAKDLGDINNAVVSCGGGVVLNKIIIDYLKKNGILVGLFADFQTIRRRVENDLQRPLFKDLAKAEELYNLRKSLYEFYADKRVSTVDKSVEEVAGEIVKIIRGR